MSCAEPVIFPEEFHQPTDAEVAAVVTSPFWAPALALGLLEIPASLLTDAEAAQFVPNGALGALGYTLGMAFTNWAGEEPIFEGWTFEDATASFATGGVTSFIPGEGFKAGFGRGAAQAGSSYLLGQGLKGESVSPGEAVASSIFGGLGGGMGDEIVGRAEPWLSLRPGAAAAAGRVGVKVAAPPGADATFNLVKELFTKGLQNPTRTPTPWTWPTTPYTLP